MVRCSQMKPQSLGSIRSDLLKETLLPLLPANFIVCSKNIVKFVPSKSYEVREIHKSPRPHGNLLPHLQANTPCISTYRPGRHLTA